MNCVVYRSLKKSDTYIYLKTEDNLQSLPDALGKLLGKLEFVMELDLSKITKLANAEISEVKERLIEDGFYLQLPREQYEAI